MNPIVEDLGKEYLNKELPELNPGDTVRVSARIIEGNKERTQTFEGTILKTDRAKKIIVYKQRPKKGYRLKQGHRQGFARVMINKIRTTATKAKAEGAETAES